MSVDSRGNTVFTVTTNKAGFRSDAITDGVLLAAAASKTITVLNAAGELATAARVNITNRSGQRADLIVTVSRAGEKRRQNVSSLGVVGPVTIVRDTETSAAPIRLLDGESIDVYERVVSIKETNGGAGAQTGIGVRYSFTLEPHYR